MLRAPRTTPALVTTTLCVLMLCGCSGDDQTTDRPQVADASSRDAKAASSAGTDMSPLDKLVGVPGDTVHRLTGAWDYEYPPADARRLIANFRDYVDHDTKRVVGRLGLLDGNEWWLGFLFDGDLILVDGVPEGDGGFYAVHDDELTTSGAHNTALVTYRWSLDGDKLTLTALEECSIEGSAKTSCTHQRRHMDPMMRMVTENTFVRSADEATY